MSTAKDLGPKDPEFGAGLIDPYRALVSLPAEDCGSVTGE